MYTISTQGFEQRQPTAAALPMDGSGAWWASAVVGLMILGIGGLGVGLTIQEHKAKRAAAERRLAWEREAIQRWA